MRSMIAKTVLSVLTILTVLLNLAFIIKDNCFYDLDSLPKGELIQRTDSLDKPYVVSFYLVDTGGRTEKAIRAESYDLETGRSYTVYWEVGGNGPMISWVSDYQMIINGHTIELTEDGVHYDSRDKVFGEDTYPNGTKNYNN